MRTKTWRISIKGETWKYKMMLRKKFVSLHSDNDQAMTIPGKKEMHFQVRDFNKLDVLHELFHAYHTTLCLESSNISIEDHEEILAELLSNNWDDMTAKRDRMYNTMKEYLNEWSKAR